MCLLNGIITLKTIDTMKKQLFLLAAILAMASSTPAWAYDFSAVAPSGQTLYYNIVRSHAEVVRPGTGSSYNNYVTGNLVIPASVTYNGTTYPVTAFATISYHGSFHGCTGLTSVTIPNSVTSIGNYTFFGCTGLTSVTIPNSVTSIGRFAFEGCTGLSSVFIPFSVTSIGDLAFYRVRHIEYYGSATGSPWGAISMNGITEGDFIFSDATKQVLLAYSGAGGSVVIPSTVETIGEAAFRGCTGLTSVTIPNSVTSIGYEAFCRCTGLTSVTIPPYSVTSIGPRVFYNCSGLTSVTIPNSVTSIGVESFYHCTGLTSVTIPSSITRIYDSAFEGCSGLTSITIPNGVTSIGNSAFRDCTGLTSVTIHNRFPLTSIGSFAFYGCSGLTSFTMGGVTSIGDYALGDCTGLRNIISKTGYPPTASNYTFENVPPSCKLTVPCGSLHSYQSTSPWNTQFPLMEEDCNPDGIDDAEIGDVMVYAANGMIYISSTLPTETTIFDITGHQVATFTAEAASIPLPAGVYLVKIGAYPARKVVVIR